MELSDEDIKRQLRLGEDSFWEFKQIEIRWQQAQKPSSP